MSFQRLSRRVLLLVVLLIGGLVGVTPGIPATAATGVQVHEPVIGGAQALVKVPANWNRRLVLYSHGYYMEPHKPAVIMLATSPQTEQWLLDQGYAVAASNFKEPFGFAVEQGVRDQGALLDWFERTVGRPRHVVSSGMSMGAGVAIKLAEQNPARFAGVLAQCSDLDLHATFNTALDISFVVRTLLAPGQDIELVRSRDPEAAKAALTSAAEQTMSTPQGRARIALAGALGNIPGWATAHQPEPKGLEEQIRQLALWVRYAYLEGMGPTGRADLERRAGGNPSWNVGVDYTRQLKRSAQRELVRDAYRAAGLELKADLNRLAAAPRIHPDPQAVAYAYRHLVPKGSTPAPILTLHNTGDGGAVSDQVRWYGDQVRRAGDTAKLRQLYSDRGSHCAFSGAEEVVALRTLFTRIETGRWPSTAPKQLNSAADALGPDYRAVFDLFTQQVAPAPAAFTSFVPPALLRPSR